MQFSIKAAFFTLAVFLPLISAVAVEKRQCEPLLQSCSLNVECCSDLCLVGVSVVLFAVIAAPLVKPDFSDILCNHSSSALSCRYRYIDVYPNLIQCCRELVSVRAYYPVRTAGKVLTG